MLPFNFLSMKKQSPGPVSLSQSIALYHSWKARDADNNTEGDHSSLTPSTILICSAFSKMIASIATYPHEVLRTRLQIRKSSPKSSSSSSIFSSNPSKPSHPPLPFSSMYFNPLSSTNGQSHPPLNASNSTASHAHPPLDRQIRPLWHSLFKLRKEGGIIDTFISIKNQDGWRGFYRGLSINLIRTVPSSAVTMLTWVQFFLTERGP